MRTNIEIDDQLMAEAMRLTALKTKREVVEAALRLLIRQRGQRALLDLTGKIHWAGNLAEMRTGRFLHDEQGLYRSDEEESVQSQFNNEDNQESDEQAANGNPG